MTFRFDTWCAVRLRLVMLAVVPPEPGGATCTIQKRNLSFCGRPALKVLDHSICAKHAIGLYLEIDSIVEANDQNDMVRTLMVLEEVDLPKRKISRKSRKGSITARDFYEPVVYYLLIDGLVKIGYTQDFNQRIKAYPPSARLLATEVGTEALERSRHSDFVEYLALGREWFHPGPKLRAHIEALDTYQPAS